MRLQVYTANAVIVFLICAEQVKVAYRREPPIELLTLSRKI